MKFLGFLGTERWTGGGGSADGGASDHSHSWMGTGEKEWQPYRRVSCYQKQRLREKEICTTCEDERWRSLNYKIPCYGARPFVHYAERKVKVDDEGEVVKVTEPFDGDISDYS